MLQKDFIEFFNSLPDWESKYEYLMERCVGLQMPPSMMIEANRIKSCSSKLYFVVEKNPFVKIYAWGNSPISLGLAGIISDIFTGREIIPKFSNINFHYKTELINHLTSARAAALDEMIRILTIS